MPLYRAGGRWVDYTPTLAGVGWAIGNGTIVGSSAFTPGRVDFSIVVTFGSTSTYGAANPTLTVPVPVHAAWTDDLMRATTRCVLADATGGTYDGRAALSSGVLLPFVINTGSTYSADNNVTSTVPFTWTNPDRLVVSGWYRPA